METNLGLHSWIFTMVGLPVSDMIATAEINKPGQWFVPAVRALFLASRSSDELRMSPKAITKANYLHLKFRPAMGVYISDTILLLH